MCGTKQSQKQGGSKFRHFDSHLLVSSKIANKANVEHILPSLFYFVVAVIFFSFFFLLFYSFGFLFAHTIRSSSPSGVSEREEFCV